MYGWKTAIKWALCLVLFIVAQIKIWLGILSGVAGDKGMGDGIVITMILSLFAFVALLITVFVVKPDQLDAMFWRVYYIYLTVNLIQVIKNFVSYGIVKGLLFNIFLLVGFYATTLIVVDMVVVAITGILPGSFFGTVAKGFARGDFMSKAKYKTLGDGTRVRDYAAEDRAQKNQDEKNKKAGLL